MQAFFALSSPALPAQAPLVKEFALVILPLWLLAAGRRLLSPGSCAGRAGATRGR